MHRLAFRKDLVLLLDDETQQCTALLIVVTVKAETKKGQLVTLPNLLTHSFLKLSSILESCIFAMSNTSSVVTQAFVLGAGSIEHCLR